jgi:hypothetical protein
MTLEGTKENVHAVIKPQNKICYKVYREYIKSLTFTKYQNIKILKENYLEAQMNAQNNK